MKRGTGVLLEGNKEPTICGYLIIGDEEYQIIGQRMSKVRTNLSVHQTIEATQGDLFDENSGASGERKCDRL